MTAAARGRGRGRGRGRRAPGDAEAAILAAARRRFGDHGFGGATIRAIATDAGVDPALVLHYYGSKADLFAVAMQVPIPIDTARELVERSAGDREQLGEALLRVVLAMWEDPDGRAAWLGMVRSAVADERAAAMLREFLVDVLLRPAAGALGGADAEQRLALVASQIVGLGVVRHVVGLEPLASATPDELVAAVAPTLQRYLTGPLGPGRR
jgi:AcrR family transcriptional regulator